jgi:hypothetical protein
MKNSNRVAGLIVFALLFLLVAGVGISAAADANVAGPWAVKVSGDAGAADQQINLTQDGNKIGGTFKGPRQSGTIEGTVDGNNIKFRVKAFVPIDYVGTVEGDTMKGTLSGRGKTGDWTATRAK